MKVCSTCSESYANEVAACPVDGTELTKSTDPYIGRTVAARYRLIRRLGVGGMASVYLARHVMIDRLSAIKILRQDFSLNPTHRERFLREARAVNRINHRNIVEITDCGEMDGIAYLVMEYVDGPTLFQELEAGPFPWVRAARIAIQIASALGRAHQMGVVHRDLKPENILLVRPVHDRPVHDGSEPPGHEAQDHVKLTDFGIAKIVDAPALTFSEHLFGTPGYIAPECIEGLPVDRRTDIYSLGVVLYEMVTGRLPYDARGAELLTAALVSAPIPPRARVPGLPEGLESLVLAMLSKSRDLRPTDAFAVEDALSRLLREQGEPGPAPGAPGVRSGMDPAPTIMEAAPISVAPSSSIQVFASQAEAPISPPHVGAPAREVAPPQELAPSQSLARWRNALRELEASLDGGRLSLPLHGGRHARIERAASLAEDAKRQLDAMERAALVAAEHQASVDRIEARGRDFRATLGHAIDELVRQQTRERLHAAAVGALHDVVHERMQGERQVAEALVWEAAVLTAEAEQARLQDDDLSHQISTLQARLEEANAEIEGELGEAAGALEGSLAALRRLTGEFVRTLEEAESELRRPSQAF